MGLLHKTPPPAPTADRAPGWNWAPAPRALRDARFERYSEPHTPPAPQPAAATRGPMFLPGRLPAEIASFPAEFPCPIRLALPAPLHAALQYGPIHERP